MPRGIQSVQNAHVAMDAHVDGIVVLNRGASLALRGGKPSNPCGLTTSLVIFLAQVVDRLVVSLARSALSTRSVHYRGCVTRKNKASLPSSSIRVSAQGAMSLRPSQ